MSGRATLIQTKTKAEGSVFVNSLLSEITRSKGVGPTVARAALASLAWTPEMAPPLLALVTFGLALSMGSRWRPPPSR